MRVAVIGGGVSGLGAAYVLSRSGHDVHLFEREPRLGGHVNTVLHDGLALDTGFIVSNARNYPLLTRLFAELGVACQRSEMSFSVSCDACGLEYAGRRPFAQWRNAGSTRFTSLMWEIGRWLRTARSSIESGAYDDVALGDYLTQRSYSGRFRRHFIVPLTSALWSAAPSRTLEIPAAYAIRFFDNHGMLGVRRHSWRTVSGGAHTYVQAVRGYLRFADTNLPVRGLRRDDGCVLVRTDDDVVRQFDRAVVATHADEALALLEDPSEDERAILGAFGYTKNDAVLHTDSSLLPRSRAAHASWNYRVDGAERPTVTYYLNRLQRLESETDYLVTLNQPVADEHVIRRMTYTHPHFSVEAIRAQRRLAEISGTRNTAFAGAYFGNGFHEDGLAAGVHAAEALGARW
ncbi:MAG TPA: FAD-dependent oxidoreductase [Gaiellaceae bacterium]|nr:FAD-dependent oxidoreductase [Gaiellaceae bacterium]